MNTLLACFALAVRFPKTTIVLLAITGLGLWHESTLPPYCATAAHRAEWACTDGTKAAQQDQSAQSGPGLVYSQPQMELALLGAGIFEPSAKVGAAIGEAESGGRSDAVHLCPPRCEPGQAPERSYGPWQINLLAHPNVSIACAESLACAAQAVATISSRGTDWTAWSTFNSGAWGKFA